MSKLITSLTTTLICLNLIGCNNLKESIEVSTKTETRELLPYERKISGISGTTHLLTITNLLDKSQTISNVQVNRGACTIRLRRGSMVLHQYSSYADFDLWNCKVDQVREVEVNIDGETKTYTF